MIRYDAKEEIFEVLELFEKHVLFIDLRIDPKTVPKGLYCYEVRSDSNSDAPYEIANHIFVDFCGTIISKNPLDLGDSGSILTNDDDWNYTGVCMSLNEFIDEKNEKENDRSYCR